MAMFMHDIHVTATVSKLNAKLTTNRVNLETMQMPNNISIIKWQNSFKVFILTCWNALNSLHDVNARKKIITT